MKEIVAIVRINMMNKTKKALTEIGVDAFFAQEVYGRGKGLVSSHLLQGAKSGYEEAIELLGDKDRLYPKRMVTIVVPDEQVDDIVEALIATNKTGKPGDGKIFVSSIPDAVRVRTGEIGEKAIV